MRPSLKRLPSEIAFSLREQDVKVQIMPLARVRRATLRYEMHNQTFKIRIPLHYKQTAIENFLREAQGWMEKQLLKAPKIVSIHQCKSLSLMGDEVELKHHSSRRTSFLLDKNKLHIMSSTPHFGPLLEKWLRQMILNYVRVKSEEYSQLLGVKIKKVSIREAKSRWGSCSTQGFLSYNWRLLFAPKTIIDYVVAHEVSHLKEMNHSLKFWRLVAQLHPEAQTARHWLKQNGAELLALQFD